MLALMSQLTPPVASSCPQNHSQLHAQTHTHIPCTPTESAQHTEDTAVDTCTERIHSCQVNKQVSTKHHKVNIGIHTKDIPLALMMCRQYNLIQ